MAAQEPELVRLHERAADNLRFIRETMERSASFTAVPGVGGMAMGAVALLAAWLADRSRGISESAWLRVWIGCLVVCIVLGGLGIVAKARRSDLPLLRGGTRKFALSMLPPLLAGALLTVALIRWGIAYRLPGVWMLAYGAGVTTGGAFSVRVVPIVGVLFMIVGGVTLFLPVELGDLMMGVSFGALHIVFGWIVARRHGG